MALGTVLQGTSVNTGTPAKNASTGSTDLMLAFVSLDGNGTAVTNISTATTGWTRRRFQANSTGAAAAVFSAAGSAANPTFTVTGPASPTIKSQIITIPGGDTTNPFGAADANITSNTGSTSPVAYPSISSVVRGSMLIRLLANATTTLFGALDYRDTVVTNANSGGTTATNHEQLITYSPAWAEGVNAQTGRASTTGAAATWVQIAGWVRPATAALFGKLQDNKAEASAAASATVTLPVAPTAGSTFLAGLSVFVQSGDVTSVVWSNNGNAALAQDRMVTGTGTNDKTYLYRRSGVTATGTAPAIQASFNASIGYNMYVAEWLGLDGAAPDATGGTDGGTTTGTAPSTTATPATSSTKLAFVVVTPGGSVTSITPGAGYYGQWMQQSASNEAIGVEVRELACTAGSAVTGNFTFGAAANWTVGMALYNAASTGTNASLSAQATALTAAGLVAAFATDILFAAQAGSATGGGPVATVRGDVTLLAQSGAVNGSSLNASASSAATASAQVGTAATTGLAAAVKAGSQLSAQAGLVNASSPSVAMGVLAILAAQFGAVSNSSPNASVRSGVTLTAQPTALTGTSPASSLAAAVQLLAQLPSVQAAGPSALLNSSATFAALTGQVSAQSPAANLSAAAAAIVAAVAGLVTGQAPNALVSGGTGAVFASAVALVSALGPTASINAGTRLAAAVTTASLSSPSATAKSGVTLLSIAGAAVATGPAAAFAASAFAQAVTATVNASSPTATLLTFSGVVLLAQAGIVNATSSAASLRAYAQLSGAVATAQAAGLSAALTGRATMLAATAALSAAAANATMRSSVNLLAVQISVAVTAFGAGLSSASVLALVTAAAAISTPFAQISGRGAELAGAFVAAVALALEMSSAVMPSVDYAASSQGSVAQYAVTTERIDTLALDSRARTDYTSLVEKAE